MQSTRTQQRGDAQREPRLALFSPKRLNAIGSHTRPMCSNRFNSLDDSRSLESRRNLSWKRLDGKGCCTMPTPDVVVCEVRLVPIEKLDEPGQQSVPLL